MLGRNMFLALRIAFMIGFWLSMCSGLLAQNWMINPLEQQTPAFKSVNSFPSYITEPPKDQVDSMPLHMKPYELRRNYSLRDAFYDKEMFLPTGNDGIKERIKSLTNIKSTDDYKLIRQAWKEVFGMDVWYPYFALKKIEGSIKKKFTVKVFKLKGEPEFEKNWVSYAFKTTF